MKTQKKIMNHITGISLGVLIILAIDARAAENGKIAFVSERDGNAEIYVMNADGSNQTRLTNNQALDSDPAFSPDGLKIAFQSQRDHPIDLRVDIYVMNADGSNQTRLTYGPGGQSSSQPDWSPDGTKIAFVRSGRIYLMNADGSGQISLGIEGDSPAWSPDGTHLAFEALAPFTFRQPDSGPYSLTSQQTQRSRRESVVNDKDAPAGICYGANDIFRINSDGTGLVNLTRNGTYDYSYHPAWSRDGLRIVFPHHNIELFCTYTFSAFQQITLDGGHRQNLSPTPLYHSGFSPNGSKITGSDGNEVYVMNADGSGLVNLTASPPKDYDPSWGVASSVSISGRVSTPDGLSLRNASVTITDQQGISRSVTTGSFGLYRFDLVRLGETYLIAVSSKRYRFGTQSILVNDNLSGIDFVGLE